MCYPRKMQPKSGVKELAITKNISRWFKKNARDLPWRRNPEPYFVWLSEIMLQQTQVTAVVPYFEKFIRKFPTVQDLAHAPLDEVYSLWAGLGYYSRARNLHKGAMAISLRLERKLGFPHTRAEWLEIPGVGEYTAGAITSIALNQPEAIVDGNVVRVLARLYAIGKIDAKKSEIWNRSRNLVSVRGVEPRVFNQALMELGAMVCKPKNPRCEICPVNEQCIGKRAPEKYPPPKPKKEWKHLEEAKAVLVTSSQLKEIFLVQNEGSAWRKGLWDFPDHAIASQLKSARLVREFSLKCVVTNHKILRTHRVFEMKVRASELKNGKWFASDELPAVSAPVKKALQKLLEF